MFIVNFLNFLKKFVYTVSVKTKAMMHFFKKSMAIVFGIVLLIFLGYLFGYDSVTDTTIHKVEVSGKIQYISEDDRNKNGNEYFPPRIIVWSWDGGSTIRMEQLESTLLAVLIKLPMVTADQAMVELLQETAAIESNRGIHITQIGGGPARGIFQMETRTIQDTLSWMRKNRLDQYKAVKVFWNSKQSEEWNYTKNIPWQIAMAASYYYRMAGNDTIKSALSREEREKIYKKHWNTHKGASTREKYLSMAKTYA